MRQSVWTPNYEFLRKELKQIRKDAGITQVELALLLDKPQSYISKYENGDRNLDYLEVLSVCIHCNTKPDEFTNHILSNIDINN